jgi:hypothetical protein
MLQILLLELGGCTVLADGLVAEVVCAARTDKLVFGLANWKGATRTLGITVADLTTSVDPRKASRINGTFKFRNRYANKYGRR